MNLRITVYAEGATERTGLDKDTRLQSRPAEILPEEQLGPVHILIKRVISSPHLKQEPKIDFLTMNRIVEDRGKPRPHFRIPRGGDISNVKYIRQFLTNIMAKSNTHMVIIVFDADGNPGLKREIEDKIADIPTPHVIGMAIQEFEAWLIADQKTIVDRLKSNLNQSTDPEKMKRGEAKKLYNKWLNDSDDPEDITTSSEIRIHIARNCNLEILKKRCPSIEQFTRDINNQIALLAKSA